jgi:hypothetical protein
MFMKKIVVILLSILLVTSTYSCNNSELNTTTTTDTAQPRNISPDSIPGVVNPGAGDPSGVIKTPVPNDRNVILPDSTY